MTLIIPEWVLWTVGLGLGVPLIAILLFLAYIGGHLLWAFSNSSLK